jgi:aspartyl-tRNA(Asn)/glutamyl-tRNA(Gln) amidotransferase subunit A
MTDSLPRSVARLAEGLVRGDYSSVELTRYYLQRIAALDPQLNSFITVCAEQALAEAAAADSRRAAGTAGPLTGIPYANKDIFCTRGVRTSCASRMLDNFIAPYDATAVERLRAAGMVMLGKTNMDEFAMGSSNESSYYGPVANPWDLARVPGGSSGGSTAAVAAGLAPIATGTDTGGSIRQPAAFCGVSGIKPTYGRVSRYGMIAFASSLDQGGPMGVSAEDLALMLNVLAGFDPRDSTSIDRPDEDFTRQLAAPLAGLRIGLPHEYFDQQLDADVRACVEQAVRAMEAQGATVKQLSLPHLALAIPAYYVIAPAECSSNLSRYDGARFGYRCANPVDLNDLYCRSRGEGFGAEVKRRILIGTYVLSSGYYDAYYRKAQQIRRLLRDDFTTAFKSVDVIVGPTTPTVAYHSGAHAADPVTMYLGDIYTTAANLAGLPSLSIPAGFVGGLPVGMQLTSNYFDEARLLGLAHRYQQDSDWHLRTPSGFN